MKKFFNLSVVVAVLAMLMSSVAVSSCSDDDDDDSTSTSNLATALSNVKTSSATSISVATGDTVVFYNATMNKADYLVVTDAASSYITFKVGGSSITLGDDTDASSYLLYQSGSYKKAQFSEASQNIPAIILEKKSGAATAESATLASSSTISGTATKTVFAKF